MGVWDIMRISMSGMFANQTAMEVVSHNIANINTPGYSTQNANLTPLSPRKQSGLYLGSGVNVDRIRRVEDRFLNHNIFIGYQSLGHQDVKSRGLDQIQEIFNESDEILGLSSALDDFWNSWSDLASAPEGSGERYGVRGKAEIMVNQFHSANRRLVDLQKNSNVEIKNNVDRINQIIEQIVDLNLRVAQVKGTGQSAGDYRAERTVLMEELAQKIDYSYFEDDSGMVTITVGGGLPLVEQTTLSQLEVRNNAANSGYYDVYFVSFTGNEFNITNQIEGGEIYGNLEIRDTYTGQMLSRLDEMAFTLINEVNALHNPGFGLNGATGNNFFTTLATAADASSLISVDAAITGDVNNIAAALSNNPGDNQNANLIAALRDETVLDGGSSTFQEFYGTIVSDVGIEAQNTDREYNHIETVMYQLRNFRESVVGVSIEEEMANLMRYEQAYQASARLINVAGDMMDVLMELG